MICVCFVWQWQNHYAMRSGPNVLQKRFMSET